MGVVDSIRYRGRSIQAADIEFIRQLIAANPGLSRRKLSAQLCRAWNWVQPNGVLRDMVCRGLLLQLHRAGHIQLPPPKFSPPNPLAKRPIPQEVEVQAIPVASSLPQLGTLEIVQVRRTSEEKLFNSLLHRFHYLGYSQPVGEHLKYVVYAGQQPVACSAWSSAPRHLAPRDRYIGWSVAQRQSKLHRIAYNTRFLILPWVQVRYLASHLLSRLAKGLSADWQQLYEHPIDLLETFIDPQRFAGTCYRAANWRYLGLSTGRGKDDNTGKANRSLKQLWVYPLGTDFRRRLTQSDE